MIEIVYMYIKYEKVMMQFDSKTENDLYFHSKSN